jgi:hypothetical protein
MFCLALCIYDLRPLGLLGLGHMFALEFNKILIKFEEFQQKLAEMLLS